MTTIGIGLAMTITLVLGIGLGTGVGKNPSWAAIYDGSAGSLIIAGYHRLGGFGKFCAFMNVLAIVSNNAPGSYSMAMNFQMLGDFWCKVPRPVFTIVTTSVYTACAIGGRNALYNVFGNVVPLIGYWVIIWLTIVAESDLIFNRNTTYDWSAWNNPLKLPVGYAATAAFLIGWVGAIIGMVCFSLGKALLTMTGPSVLHRTDRLDNCRRMRFGDLAWTWIHCSCVSAAKNARAEGDWTLKFVFCKSLEFGEYEMRCIQCLTSCM